jgi:hypothetical protein
VDRTFSRVFAVLLLTALGAIAASSGCSGSRFPGCQTNADCTSDETPKPGEKKHGVCFDFRCVECHYDDDCPDATMCNKLNECASLSSTKATDSATPTGSSSLGPGPRAF